mgnify:CR=1 FL=1|jgi:N-dimethylarginine dimethylaminohydrolase
MILNIKNETSTLKTVILGQSHSNGISPRLQDTYDAKSYETVLKEVYPAEEAIQCEMAALEKILMKHRVEVLKPSLIENCNQVFARDAGFVIDDTIINSNIIPNREEEKIAYENVYTKIAYNKIYNLPERAHVEGGDVILYNDLVFVGLYTGNDYANLKTARTNLYAYNFLKELFPNKTFIPLELVKHDTDPRIGILHLDCTFMPVGKDKAIIYKQGFKHIKDYKLIKDIFGESSVFEITQDEMYKMNTNIFSISPKTVVSEMQFGRLNDYMENDWGLQVEKVPYYEISKMGGLLRCSTFPLIRDND